MTKVLFVCTGNSDRSQMAEGFARALVFRLSRDEIERLVREFLAGLK